MSLNRTIVMAEWKSLLDDIATLLENPSAHHNKLLSMANLLYVSQEIDRDDLSDMLELADGALAYAVEAQICSEAKTSMTNSREQHDEGGQAK